ncbi:HET-domain-containing protein [Glonium stellatum]|uniref:HET-domain-containing protein n=1 Tax=Glonium stellatum TaxID=574774 RepID=A0A8E2FB63_9PEZI|nr:HET-domain-containing protein [Glonium stellatum]
MPNATPNGNSTFCEVCCQLRISLPSFIKHPGYNAGQRLSRPAVFFGRFADLRGRLGRCVLCRLVFGAFLGGPLKNALIRANANSLSEDVDGIQISATWANALGPKDEQCTMSSALFLIFNFSALLTESSDYKIVIRALSPAIPHYPHFGRLVKTPFLDLSLIKSWLRQCERCHGRCEFITETNGRHFHFFTVIDVKKSCIVEITGSCRYLALSYVWGSRPQLKLTTRNIEELSRAGGLLKGRKEPHVCYDGPYERLAISRVVLDAMKLTKGLGERYLWVDALCIVQDNLRIQRQCIEDMDLIYTRAILTIVAASGTCADDPLPGVTSERHSKQFFIGVSRNFALSAHFDYKDYLNKSVYSQRAWTFQEEQLARRSLIFAGDGHAYLSCKEAVFSEEVVSEGLPSADFAMKLGANFRRLESDLSSLASQYRHAVVEYTSRHLTKSGDILNAFSGILNLLCQEQKLEGLPVSIFDLALLWQPTKRLGRRFGFASWSWAGWHGQVHWFHDGLIPSGINEGRSEQEQVQGWLKKQTWITWYSNWGASMNTLCDGPSPLRTTSVGTNEHTKRFPSLANNFLPSKAKLKGRAGEPQYHRFLQFWTVSAVFNIRPTTISSIRYSAADPEFLGAGLAIYHITNADDCVCGWVLLDESWAVSVETKHEFIMLAAGKHHMDFERPHADHPWKDWRYKADELLDGYFEYYTMMIRWNEGVAERLGLGRVMQQALDHGCGARWKEILLG